MDYEYNLKEPKDTALVIHRKDKPSLQWAPKEGFAILEGGSAAIDFGSQNPVDYALTHAFMSLNTMNFFISLAHQVPGMHLDKARCVEEIENCKKRLFRASQRFHREHKKIPFFVVYRPKFDQIANELVEENTECVHESLNALRHLGLKCKEASTIFQYICDMEARYQSQIKELERNKNQLPVFPDQEEYDTEFFVSWLEMKEATIRYHFREYQKQRPDRQLKYRGRWCILNKEGAKLFADYCHRNRADREKNVA